MGIAVLINIVLDLCFVPRFGGIGAAMATSISFFVWNIVTLIISERLWSIHYPLRIFGLQIGVGVAGCWWILSIYQNNLPIWQVGVIVIITSIILMFTVLKFNKFMEIYKSMKIKLFGINK